MESHGPGEPLEQRLGRDGRELDPVATPSVSAASLASITVSAKPPTLATTGTVP
jgi:hypothetical protein